LEFAAEAAQQILARWPHGIEKVPAERYDLTAFAKANQKEKGYAVPTELREIEDLRAQHQVRIVTEEEDGTGIDRLPKGVYGFTYSPAADNFPLFYKNNLNCYEAHKLPDGSALLVGYLNKEEASQLASNDKTRLLHLFPNPNENATELAILPMARVVGHEENSHRKGKGFEIQVAPEK